MKYQNLPAFYKHLTSSFPHHLCSSYLILTSDEEEKRSIIHQLLSFLPGKRASFRAKAEDYSIQELLDPFLSFSLFEETPVVVLEEIEALDAKEAEILKHFLKKKIDHGFLIGTAKSKTSFSSSFEKSGVVVDLLEEKPWDRDKRVADQLIQKVQKLGKTISSRAFSLFLELVGKESSILHRELEKLITYVGDKALIDEEDVIAVTSFLKAKTIWQVAEELVFEKKIPVGSEFTFSAMVAPIRSQLQLGKKIAELISSNIPFSEWHSYLPKIFPKMLEKRAMQVQKLGASYFDKALDHLFSLELLSRHGQTHEEALLSLFGGMLGR